MHWRDCDAWRQENLSMNTTSNEAAKLYDCCLTQLVKWREDQLYGGIDGTLAQMLNADPSFVMGHVLKCGTELIGNALPSPKSPSTSVETLLSQADIQSPNLSKREMMSVEAIKEISIGNTDKACEIWERILVEHPKDMLALKFAHDVYFYTGSAAQMRDSCARVLPRWRQTDPLYSFLYGMHSFGLVQTNMHEFARKAASYALELNPQDAWATHTLCHYNEYRNDTAAGITLLRDTESNWSPANLLSTHNYWHWCVYHVERGEHDQALSLYDKRLCDYLQLNRTYDMVDLVSLLFRLQLDGCSVPKEKWHRLKKIYSTRVRDHGYTFNDAHIVMLLSQCGATDEKEEFFNSLDEHLKQDLSNSSEITRDACNNIVFDHKNLGSYLRHVNRKLGVNLYHAICYFDSGEYAQVVELLNPIKYDLYKIGGSNAQRDMFHQMLTQAALRSSFHTHNRLGLALVNERFGMKPDSKLTRRLAERFAAVHHFD